MERGESLSVDEGTTLATVVSTIIDSEVVPSLVPRSEGGRGRGGGWGLGLGVYRGWVLVPYRNELESIRVPLYRSHEPGFCTPLPLARMSIGLAHTNQVADPSRRVQGPN